MRLTTRLTGRPWLGLGAALLFAIEGRGLDFSTGGMEAGFNQLAILSTFLLLIEKRTRWAAAALGLAVLIRPDGHVAWVGEGDAGGLADAMRTWCGPAVA